MRKVISMLLLAAMMLCLFTGCHGSKEQKVFEIPEEFDTSRNYEISFWAKNDTNMTQVEIYKKAIEELERNTNQKYDKLYIVGGGAKNIYLNRLTEEFTGKKVVALPIEATALGNIAIQFMSSGVIEDIKQARKIIARGENLKLYTPTDRDEWEKAYEAFKEIVK